MKGPRMNRSRDLPDWSAQGPAIELSEETCWDLVAGPGVGRLGVSVDDLPEIFPVNYFADGRSIVFRSADGTKLRSLISNRHVVFEMDSVGDLHNWSVTVKGLAEVKDDTYENRAADEFLPPWNPVTEYVYVEILPSSITGRQFEHHLNAVRRSDDGSLSSEL
jgi:nitroimidazol reductase NimA-like FMN-containing flavoprotein (pyridoxamine 5'-phosphate oxidase superfamily)